MDSLGWLFLKRIVSCRWLADLRAGSSGPSVGPRPATHPVRFVQLISNPPTPPLSCNVTVVVGTIVCLAI